VHEQAAESVVNVEEGNKELAQAIEYRKGNGDLFATIFTLLAVLLWIWEYLNT